MSKDKTAGQISLPGIFSAAAQELLTSIQRGRILHKTHNIRDAGAPLEASFRDLVAALRSQNDALAARVSALETRLGAEAGSAGSTEAV